MLVYKADVKRLTEGLGGERSHNVRTQQRFQSILEGLEVMTSFNVVRNVGQYLLQATTITAHCSHQELDTRATIRCTTQQRLT